MSKYLTIWYINIGPGPHSSVSVNQIKAEDSNQGAKKEVQEAEGNFGAEEEVHRARIDYVFAIFLN
jgi:hypothetical protein